MLVSFKRLSWLFAIYIVPSIVALHDALTSSVLPSLSVFFLSLSLSSFIAHRTRTHNYSFIDAHSLLRRLLLLLSFPRSSTVICRSCRLASSRQQKHSLMFLLDRNIALHFSSSSSSERISPSHTIVHFFFSLSLSLSLPFSSLYARNNHRFI